MQHRKTQGKGYRFLALVATWDADFHLPDWEPVVGVNYRPNSEKVKRTPETCLFQAFPAADAIERQIALAFPPYLTPPVTDRRKRHSSLGATVSTRHKIQNDIMAHGQRGARTRCQHLMTYTQLDPEFVILI